MENLVEGLKNGNKEAIKELYHGFYNHCKWAILNNGGTDEDSKEIFQQAVFSLMEKVQNQEYKIDSLKSYLFNACKFIWYDTKRKRLKTKSLATFPEDIEDEVTDSLNDFWEDRKNRMYQGLNKLEEGCRNLLELFFFEKRSDKEIAPILGYKLGFVRVKRSRCIEKLRRFVQ